MKKTKVSLFCGGSGSESIIKYLLSKKNIELTLLINAYDDGKSTGALRKNIPGLLGPSDFRKNFSYLINFFSDEERSLKKIFEYRIKKKISVESFYHNIININKYKSQNIPNEINFLEKNIKEEIINYLIISTKYLIKKNLNLVNFSLGNLIFAGIFLKNNNNFNLAVKKFANFINSDVKIINISNNENRWLVAINNKNQIINEESKLVENKQLIPIKNIFLIKKKEEPSYLDKLNKINSKKKFIYLKKINSIPQINNEAKINIINSDYIIYGPGTQHSSLFPSYLISNKYIKKSKSKKILIMNLDYDNDIKTLKTKQILIQGLKYLNYNKRTDEVVNTVIVDKDCKFDDLSGRFRETEIKKIDVRNNFIKKIHSGKKIYDEIFLKKKEKNLILFINLKNKKNLNNEHLDQVFTQNWNHLFEKITIVVNKKINLYKKKIPNIIVKNFKRDFPEMQIFNYWYKKRNYNYLVTISGDGFYDLSKIIEHINLMKDLNCGLLIGSRNQSRSQHFENLVKIYGKNNLLYFFSKISEFFFIIAYFIKLKFFLMDPNSGYRIYSKDNLSVSNKIDKYKYPSTLLKNLVNNKTEVLEVPIKYYVKRNFSAIIIRFSNAIKNLKGLYFD
jgi:2-phospho-L-lactate transferase/gluconeogenesis factor (CofD/UPF0052 family)